MARWALLCILAISCACTPKSNDLDPALLGTWKTTSDHGGLLGYAVGFFKTGDASLDGAARTWKVIDDHTIRIGAPPDEHDQVSPWIVTYEITGDRLSVSSGSQTEVYLRQPRVASR